MTPRAAMEIVHERFTGANPELANGFAEHAPMGADAMIELGLDPDDVVRWAARHAPEPLTPGSPIHTTYLSISAELDSGDWAATAGRHVARLVDRLDAHLFHGLIRTAHATRALRRDDTPAGRHELALGLAAWVAWSSRDADHGPEPEPEPVEGEPIAFVTDAARRGAAAFLLRPSIITIHAVTGPMAFLLVTELVDDAALGRGAAVFARTHRAYGPPTTATAVSTRPSREDLTVLLSQWDAHPAKFVEAALRAHDLTGDGVFLDAARSMLR